ncbi:LOW QUALITY PROTEIN: glutamic acid-rich protein [Paramyrothecium foliicola]|nr:LOW QUALITY PROTEIN: glutamic acid-rich protein [Paramyrothecium foliicola]
MAEMESDASHHLNFGTDLDEDLITYESDVADRHELENDVTWNQQPLDNNVEVDEELFLDAGFNPEDADQEDGTEIEPQEPTDPPLQPSSPVENTQESSTDVAQDQGSVMEDERERQNAKAEESDNEHDSKDGDGEPIDFFAPGDQGGELLEDGVNTNMPSVDEVEGTADFDHEIDYDHNEPEEKHFSDNGESLNPADDGGSGVDSTDTHPTVSEKDHSSNQQDSAPTDTASGENEEITWEEGGAIITNAGSTAEESQPDVHETTDLGHEVEVDNGQDEDRTEAVEQMDEDGSGNEHYSEVGSDQRHHAATDSVLGDASVHSDSEHQDFPAITVQYKGDEFPFFSSSADGFFAEAAVLDDDMKSLMAGFRAELANEIATDEELIFQVDELGLEFSESSLNEALSGITLRQILEVFDLLVKNQDPDSSRVLYTYLFTRPSTSKRFEFLVESATAGKGLDEVIHLFASPMPHGNRVVAEATRAEDNYDHNLDIYESAEDMKETEHTDLEENDDNQATEEFDTTGHEDLQTQANRDDQDGAHQDSQTPASATHQQTDIVETGLTDAEPESVPNDTQELGHTQSKLGANISLESDDNLSGAQNHEGIELAGHNDDHSPDKEAEVDIASSEAGLAPEIAIETSTTNTLDENADAESLAADVDLDFTADPEIAQEGLDELAEIDWRHEADDLDAPGDTLPGAGKRPRADDELSIDDDKAIMPTYHDGPTCWDATSYPFALNHGV